MPRGHLVFMYQGPPEMSNDDAITMGESIIEMLPMREAAPWWDEANRDTMTNSETKRVVGTYNRFIRDQGLPGKMVYGSYSSPSMESLQSNPSRRSEFSPHL